VFSKRDLYSDGERSGGGGFLRIKFCLLAGVVASLLGPVGASAGGTPKPPPTEAQIRACVEQNLARYSGPDKAVYAQYVDLETACRAALTGTDDAQVEITPIESSRPPSNSGGNRAASGGNRAASGGNRAASGGNRTGATAGTSTTPAENPAAVGSSDDAGSNSSDAGATGDSTPTTPAPAAPEETPPSEPSSGEAASEGTPAADPEDSSSPSRGAPASTTQSEDEVVIDVEEALEQREASAPISRSVDDAPPWLAFILVGSLLVALSGLVLGLRRRSRQPTA